MGRLGQKTGAGWYRYAEGDRTPHPDPEVDQVIREESEREGITRRDFTDEDIRRRILHPMINEGMAILEEGIALRPLDIDLVEIHGYGFPRWRGGLMYHGDVIGAEALRDSLAALAEETGDAYAYRPQPLLDRLADRGAPIGSLNDGDA